MNIIYTIFLLIIMISCGISKSESKSKISNEKSKISFKDQFDRIIILDKPAENIVMFPNPGPSVLIAVDGGVDRLKGMNPHAKTVLITGIFGEFFSKLASIPTEVMTEHFVPNIEELIKINPDLVFKWGHKSQLKHIKTIEKLGLKVATFDWDGKRDMGPGWLKMLGHAIGKSKKAKEMIEWRNKLWNKLKSEAEKIPEKDRLRTFYFAKFKNNYKVGELLSMNLLKANNVARTSKKDDFSWTDRPVNIEQIIQWNPEIILLNALEQLDGDVSPSDIYKNPLFAEIDAVKNKRVYKLPRIHDQEPEMPLEWMWLAMILYPDYFNFDLRKEMKIWYKKIYGKVPSEWRIKSILRIGLNKGSKNYERFID